MEKNWLGSSSSEKETSIIMDHRQSQPCHAVAEKSDFMLGVCSVLLYRSICRRPSAPQSTSPVSDARMHLGLAAVHQGKWGALGDISEANDPRCPLRRDWGISKELGKGLWRRILFKYVEGHCQEEKHLTSVLIVSGSSNILYLYPARLKLSTLWKTFLTLQIVKCWGSLARKAVKHALLHILQTNWTNMSQEQHGYGELAFQVPSSLSRWLAWMEHHVHGDILGVEPLQDSFLVHPGKAALTNSQQDYSQ